MDGLNVPRIDGCTVYVCVHVCIHVQWVFVLS